tara:strand:- start:1550 stop:2863 length:1314 start_codon:yes stop_codon:yes gene_type:complete
MAWSQEGNTCESDELLIENKVGWGSSECCVEKNNFCLNKDWDCPDGLIDNPNSLDISCDIDTCPENDAFCRKGCPETDVNIEKCCEEGGKCGTFTCPQNYHNDPRNLNTSCQEEICTTENDLELCCSENERCSDLYCGRGVRVLENKKDDFCKEARCTLRNDRDNCCSIKKKCKDMECPVNHYNKPSSLNKSCFTPRCDKENRIDVRKCCEECSPVENASEYICSSNTQSIATKCNDGYIVETGVCVEGVSDIEGEKQRGNVKLRFEADYDEFIKDDNHATKIKEDICRVISNSRNISYEKCLKLIQISDITKGSVIVSFNLNEEELEIDENERVTNEDINDLFQPGVELPELKIKTLDPPEINVEDTIMNCSSEEYIHTCPFYMKLKNNATDIKGVTNDKCCSLNWKVLRIVIPTVISIVILLYLWFKYKISRMFD